MRKCYSYIVLIIVIALNVCNYIITWTTPDGLEKTREVNSLFYSQTTLITSAYTSGSIVFSIILLVCLTLIWKKQQIWELVFALLLTVSLTKYVFFWTYFNAYLGIGFLKVEIITLFLLFGHLYFSKDLLPKMEKMMNEHN